MLKVIYIEFLSIFNIFFVLAAKNIKNFELSTYSNVLFASTIGTFGYNSFVCSQTKLDSNQTITLNCEKDFLQMNSSIYGLLAPVDYISDGCFYNDLSTIDISCIDSSKYKQFFKENCENKTSCSFLPNETLFNSSTDCQDKLKSYYIYFNAYCLNDYLSISGGSQIDKSYIPIIISFCDAAIILFYIFMLISLEISQKKAINNVLHNSLSPALYTLEVSNLPSNLNKEALIVGLWKHMENVLNDAHKNHNQIFKIVDIQLAQKDSMINLSDKKGELIRKVHLIY